MNFGQEFRLSFGERFPLLQLKNVVVKKNENVLYVNFLYPSEAKELSFDEKKEISDWLIEKLDLQQLKVRTKFQRVFVEEKLILKAICAFFENKYKLVTTYVCEENFKITITQIDVLVEIELSSRMTQYMSQHKIANELAKFLKDNFLIEFVVSLKENAQLLDEVDIENVEIKATYKTTKRFKVEVLQQVAGTKFSSADWDANKQLVSDGFVENQILKPEFLSNIRSPKSAVYVAGFLKKIERKEFIQKKGKSAGKERTFFSFTLDDGKGKMDGIYFCPSGYVSNMDKLEEAMFVVVQGDVNVNQKTGNLQLLANKIALANPIQEIEEEKPKVFDECVVLPEKLQATQQDSMFEIKNKYNAKIMGRRIVVFDIETTGLDDSSDQIIELGAVKIENGSIIEKFSTFVKPTKKIPYEVTNLTGITNEMVANAPPIQPVIRDFYNFTRGCVLSGHNVINFDIKFIKREGKTLDLDFDNDLIDTMNEARVARLKISRFNLATVTKALGISLEGAHRAWNDAFATAQVLLKLNQIG